MVLVPSILARVFTLAHCNNPKLLSVLSCFKSLQIKVVLFLLQIQVGRLGRSKSLSMSEYEVTSTSCVKGAKMPPDALRW